MMLNEERHVVEGEGGLCHLLLRWITDLSKLGDPGVGTAPI